MHSRAVFSFTMSYSTSSIDRDSPLPVIGVLLVIFALVAAYVAGLFPDVMETDAAQYASISREMAETGNYLQVYHRGGDYLDKPPLLFWLSSLSISAFGNVAWAYKLPSFLFTILGLWSVFRFTLIYYPRKVAWFSFLILGTCQAWFLFNNDVRTDTMLAASVIFSVWQIARFLEYRNYWGIVLGGVGIAAAMLAKGPIGIMAPALAVASHLFFSRRMRTVFNPAWLLMLLIVAAGLVPMCYGLYKQYGNEGLEFFFWKQSFGRITGENEWRNDTGYFFFVHTFFWTFMPWALLALPAMAITALRLFRNRFKTGKSLPETISLFGFILPFVALSFSHYKLPHYIFVTFPFAAVFCAKFLYDSLDRPKKKVTVWITLTPAVVALVAVSGLACAYVFPHLLPWVATVAASCILLGIILWTGKKTIASAEKILYTVVVAACMANFSFNIFFYPDVLAYQPGKAAAAWLKQHAPHNPSAIYYISDHPLEFRAGKIFPYLYAANSLDFVAKHPNPYIYGDDLALKELQDIPGYEASVAATFERHHPALLTIKFLNPSTRKQSLEKRYWITLRKRE